VFTELKISKVSFNLHLYFKLNENSLGDVIEMGLLKCFSHF